MVECVFNENEKTKCYKLIINYNLFGKNFLKLPLY